MRNSQTWFTHCMIWGCYSNVAEIQVIWHVTPCRLVNSCRLSDWSSCLNLQVRAVIEGYFQNCLSWKIKILWNFKNWITKYRDDRTSQKTWIFESHVFPGNCFWHFSPIRTLIARQTNLRSYTSVYGKIKLVDKSTGASLQVFEIRKWPNTYGQWQIIGEQLGGYRRQLVWHHSSIPGSRL